MSKVISFVKSHWTWISGLLLTVWSYASPGFVQYLGHLAASYPASASLIAALIAFLAHISPSPIAKNGTMKGPGVGSALGLGLLITCLVMAPVSATGCSFSSFIAAAEADLPVVVTMITNITNIIAPAVSAEIVLAGTFAESRMEILCGKPALGAKQCDAVSLVGEYQAAVDSSIKMSILQRIRVAMLAVQGHLSDMLKIGPGVPQGIAAALSSAVGLAILTLTEVISLIPTSGSVANRMGTAMAAQAPPHPEALRKAYNNAVRAQFAAAQI